MGAEFAKLAREVSAANEDYEQYLLRLAAGKLTGRGDPEPREGGDGICGDGSGSGNES